MNVRRLPLLMILMGATLLLPWTGAAPTGLADDAASQRAIAGLAATAEQTTVVPVDAVAWTRWRPEQFALADDGDWIWIGRVDGVVRRHKATGEQQHFGTPEGFPRGEVLAISVDTAGNRWFGGTAGLVRLDAEENWDVFTPASSGLPLARIDGIAVTADGALWLSHDWPDGPVSRRDPDGSFHSFAGREEAVVSDYAQILSTLNKNPLWTVAGGQVWVGYVAFDGQAWIDRTPPDAGSPLVVDVDSTGTVWVLEIDDSFINWWDGQAWNRDTINFLWDPTITTMAVGSDDRVWLGYVELDHVPRGRYLAGVSVLAPDAEPELIYRPGPVTTLLPTDEGTWAIGPGWLMLPDQSVEQIASPAFEWASMVAVSQQQGVAVHSRTPLQEFDMFGTVQFVRDRTTAVLADDGWDQATGFDVEIFKGVARTPNEDLWIAYTRLGYWEQPENPIRLHQGEWFVFRPPTQYFPWIFDMYAQSHRDTWFAYAESWSWMNPSIAHLDDGGTVADTSDDTWTIIPQPESGCTSLAVDAAGQLWCGGGGLFRYEPDPPGVPDPSWVLVNPEASGDIVPAPDGSLFVQQPGLDVLIVSADGSQTTLPLPDAVALHYDQISATMGISSLWSVAPDGAVWTFDRSGVQLRLVRHDGENTVFYETPFRSDDEVGSLDVDAANHVWMIADAAVWRMSPWPGISLDAVPSRWFLRPGSSRTVRSRIAGVEGYANPATLAFDDLPAGISAAVEPTTVQIGQAVTVTLQVDSAVPLGDYGLSLTGVGARIGGTISHTLPITISVVSDVHDRYLPGVGF